MAKTASKNTVGSGARLTQRGISPFKVITGILVAIAIGAVMGWALKTLFDQPDTVLEEQTWTLVAVESGTLDRTLNLNSAVEWERNTAARNRAEGVLTSINARPDHQTQIGDVLYTVDGRPVFATSGTWPMHRDITQGAKGEDVKQLQELLSATGYLDTAIDGDAGPSTVAAIKLWQKVNGLEQTGVILAGDVVAIDGLPARVELDPETFELGVRLSGDEQIFQVVDNPRVFMNVQLEQAAIIPPDTPVQLNYDGWGWTGMTGAATPQENSSTATIDIHGNGGSPICGTDCSALPVSEDLLIDTTIVIIPETAGAKVPTAALKTGVAGDVHVVDESGQNHPVTVKASTRGMAIVDGIDPGLRVRVPGQS